MKISNWSVGFILIDKFIYKYQAYVGMIMAISPEHPSNANAAITASPDGITAVKPLFEFVFEFAIMQREQLLQVIVLV